MDFGLGQGKHKQFLQGIFLFILIAAPGAFAGDSTSSKSTLTPTIGDVAKQVLVASEEEPASSDPFLYHSLAERPLVINPSFQALKELSIHGDYSPNGVINRIVGLGASYTWNSSALWGWEIVDLYHFTNIETPLGRSLSSQEMKNHESLKNPQTLILSKVVFKPLYGKGAFNGNYFTRAAVSFLGGAGAYSTGSNRLHPCLSFGIKGQWVTDAGQGLRLDLTAVRYLESNGYQRSTLLVSAGWFWAQ